MNLTAKVIRVNEINKELDRKVAILERHISSLSKRYKDGETDCRLLRDRSIMIVGCAHIIHDLLKEKEELLRD